MSNYLFLKAFEVYTGKKSGKCFEFNDYGKTFSFCKYFRNEGFDLHEIVNLSSYDSNELPQNILALSMHTHTHTRHNCIM